jgi:hypothetical protein
MSEQQHTPVDIEVEDILRLAKEARRVVLATGCRSVSDYMLSHPDTSLDAMLESLELPREAKLSLMLAWTGEARDGESMARCARQLLTRLIRDEMPEGWPDMDALDLKSFNIVMYILQAALPKSCDPAIERIKHALLMADVRDEDEDENEDFQDGPFAPGWRPHFPDDPALVGIFARVWGPKASTN